jgi:hypothetical protein
MTTAPNAAPKNIAATDTRPRLTRPPSIASTRKAKSAVNERAIALQIDPS